MKRSHLIISIAVIAVLFIGVVVFINSSRETEPPAPDWQHHYDLGMRFLSQGNYQEAVIAFRAAIEINPRQADAYLGLAEAYVRLGDVDAAIAVLREGYDLTGDMRLRERISELDTSQSNNESTAGATAIPEAEDTPPYNILQGNEIFVPISVEAFLHPDIHHPQGHRWRQTFERDSGGFIVRTVNYGPARIGAELHLDTLVAQSEVLWEYDEIERGWWRTHVDFAGHFDGEGVWHDWGRIYHDSNFVRARLPIRDAQPVMLGRVWVEAFPLLYLESIGMSMGEDGRIENRFFDAEASGSTWAYVIYQFDELGNAIFVTTYGGNGEVIGEAWIEWGVLE